MKYYKSIERREIYLPSDLTMEFVPFFISTVNEMISIPSKDITLYCSSYGGDLYAAFSIIDYINLIEANVNTICIGASMSAASIILGSGTGKRAMSKNSTLMIHSAVFEEGKTSYEAALAAGPRRFRPILLTSVTTFAGLFPLLIEKSVQAKFLVPMAISLAYGVLFATIITLLLVPTSYLIIYDFQNWLKK